MAPYLLAAVAALSALLQKPYIKGAQLLVARCRIGAP